MERVVLPLSLEERRLQQLPYVVGIDPGTVNFTVAMMAVDESCFTVRKVPLMSRCHTSSFSMHIIDEIEGILWGYVSCPQYVNGAVERQMNDSMIRIEQTCLAAMRLMTGKTPVQVHPKTWQASFWKKTFTPHHLQTTDNFYMFNKEANYKNNKLRSIEAAKAAWSDKPFDKDEADAVNIATWLARKLRPQMPPAPSFACEPSGAHDSSWLEQEAIKLLEG